MALFDDVSVRVRFTKTRLIKVHLFAKCSTRKLRVISFLVRVQDRVAKQVRYILFLQIQMIE